MNRQTLAVTFGTLALVTIGAILLYASPTPGPTQGERPAPARAAKAKTAPDKIQRLPPAKLLHTRPVPADRPAAPDGAPNVVFVMASTQRRDQWGIYGGDPKTTPFLAQEVAKGVVMMDALAAAVDPHVAASALTTGRHPHHVGTVAIDGKRNSRPVAAKARLLAERFSGAGWLAVGVSANFHVNHRMGQAQGFDWYQDSQPFSFMIEQRTTAQQVVKAALGRLASRSDADKARPVFLQLSVVDSHKPFKITPEEFKAFEGPDHAVAPYRATVARLDAALEQLVTGLEAHGVTADNTVFVIAADHGEGLSTPPAHRRQHGFVLYESTVRIPWVMWGKGIPKGRKVPGLASQIDVAPTIAGLAGLDVEGFDGLDLTAAVTGEVPETPRTEHYADTLYEGVHRASMWTSSRQCQKDYGSKTIDDDQFETACYDRAADPNFTTPIDDEVLMAKLEAKHAELYKAAGGAQ